jgi:hypothetical protein
MITPIETLYEGCRFRSRLEARWAVFFDTLGLKWRYEPEGFSIDWAVNYLPDFLVDDVGWIEIKPNTETDNRKWEAFCLAYQELDGFHAYKLTGDIPSPSFDGIPPDLTIDAFHGGACWAFDEGYAWCLCPDCGRAGIAWNGFGNRICGGERPRKFTSDSARIKVAYVAARSMRFEEVNR